MAQTVRCPSPRLVMRVDWRICMEYNKKYRRTSEQRTRECIGVNVLRGLYAWHRRPHVRFSSGKKKYLKKVHIYPTLLKRSFMSVCSTRPDVLWDICRKNFNFFLLYVCVCVESWSPRNWLPVTARNFFRDNSRHIASVPRLQQISTFWRFTRKKSKASESQTNHS